MSKIVERMARAYCAADGSEPDWFMRDEDGKDVLVWTDKAIGIRAALRSVRPEDVGNEVIEAFSRTIVEAGGVAKLDLELLRRAIAAESDQP